MDGFTPCIGYHPSNFEGNSYVLLFVSNLGGPSETIGGFGESCGFRLGSCGFRLGKKKHLDQDMFGCVDVDEQLSSLKQLCGSQSGYVSLFHRSVFLSTVGSASKNQGLSCQLMTLTYQI